MTPVLVVGFFLIRGNRRPEPQGQPVNGIDRHAEQQRKKVNARATASGESTAPKHISSAPSSEDVMPRSWQELTNKQLLVSDKRTKYRVTIDFGRVFAFIAQFRDDSGAFDLAAVKDAILHHTLQLISPQVDALLKHISVLAQPVPEDVNAPLSQDVRDAITAIKTLCLAPVGYQALMTLLQCKPMVEPTTLETYKDASLLFAAPDKDTLIPVTVKQILSCMDQYRTDDGQVDVARINYALNIRLKRTPSLQTQQLIQMILSMT
jgi:hypothetical protein